MSNIDKQLARKPTRFYSTQQERKVATALDGTNDLQSGGGKWRKYDVELEDWAIECKTKIVPCKSLSFSKEWFEQAESARSQMLKSYGAVCFSFGDGENFYAVDENTFKFLLSISRGE